VRQYTRAGIRTAGALLAGFFLPCGALAPGRPGNTGPGDTSTLDWGGSYGQTSDLELNGTEQGESGSLNAFASYRLRLDTGTPVSWEVGPEFDVFTFNPSPGVFIPDRAGSMAMALVVNWRMAEKWHLSVTARPGVYSDFTNLDLEDFNTPVLSVLTYQWNDRLTLGAALSINARNRALPLIGGVGLRWQMSERWALSLLFPRPRLEVAPNPQWRLWVGGEFKSGAYHLSENFGTRLGAPQLDSEFMEYREIRAGVGAEYQLGEHWRFRVDAGWLLDRRWDFDAVDMTYDGKGAAYGQLAVNYRF